ncbi:hypothetical protein [Komagataeibacter diospyri]|uniref:hypothetical protein n=1 Tax=Komagataeibacter diospyri TaxID=1932662 RepID=UPI00375731A6
MKKPVMLSFVALLIGGGVSHAQSAPNWAQNYIPSPREWHDWWASKMDVNGNAGNLVINGQTLSDFAAGLLTSVGDKLDKDNGTATGLSVANPTSTGRASVLYNVNGSIVWELGSDAANADAMILGRYVSGVYKDNPISVDLASGLVTVPDGLTASTLNADTIVGNVSSSTVTATGASTARTLADRALSVTDVRDYGAVGDGATDNGAPFTNAIAAAEADNLEVNFPYSSKGYVVNTGTFTNKMLGRFNFNGNVLSGAALGTPGTGAGVLNSLYTNPWLIVANTKEEIDPAALTLPSSGSALIGHAVECLPNRPNTGDTVTTKRMVSCLYAGADTGTGGASGTNYSMEVRNDVLNLSSNSGAAYEIDLNFNGKVLDGGISRGLFITGGGAAGNTTSSVAVDIQHNDYSGGLLPWSTGISVRDATVSYQAYARSDGSGFLFQGYNSAETEVASIDTNGYAIFAGIATSASYTPTSSSTCTKGAVMNDDSYAYFCTSAGTWKRIALSSL